MRWAKQMEAQIARLTHILSDNRKRLLSVTSQHHSTLDIWTRNEIQCFEIYSRPTQIHANLIDFRIEYTASISPDVFFVNVDRHLTTLNSLNCIVKSYSYWSTFKTLAPMYMFSRRPNVSNHWYWNSYYKERCCRFRALCVTLQRESERACWMLRAYGISHEKGLKIGLRTCRFVICHVNNLKIHL